MNSTPERKHVHTVFIYRIGERRIAQFVRRYGAKRPADYKFYEIGSDWQVARLVVWLGNCGMEFRKGATAAGKTQLIAERAC